MKNTKINEKISLFIFIILIILIIYLLYNYLFSTLYSFSKKDSFDDATITPTTTYNISEGSNDAIKNAKAAESSSASKPIPEDSYKCSLNLEVIDFCINYNSCCSKQTEDNKCMCSLPFIKNCKSSFDSCLTNNPNKLSESDLMTSCMNANKSCCNEYNNIQLDSSKFADPIKNEPSIVPMCGIKNIKDLPQKCLELCENNPNCKSYSVNLGKLAQSVGDCYLYDQISITKKEIDLKTGKPKNNIATDYFVKN